MESQDEGTIDPASHGSYFRKGDAQVVHTLNGRGALTNVVGIPRRRRGEGRTQMSRSYMTKTYGHMIINVKIN